MVKKMTEAARSALADRVKKASKIVLLDAGLTWLTVSKNDRFPNEVHMTEQSEIGRVEDPTLDLTAWAQAQEACDTLAKYSPTQVSRRQDGLVLVTLSANTHTKVFVPKRHVKAMVHNKHLELQHLGPAMN